MTVSEQMFFPIRELSTYQGSKWTIKGRVTSRAPMRTFQQRNGTGQGMVFHVELLDKEGGEIRASFFNEAAEKLYDLMEVGKCFTLSKGSVRIANKQYNTCKHRYELVFDKMCQVDPVEDDSSIDTVKFAIENIRSVQGKTLPCSVDICGIITAADPPIAFESKDKKALVKRQLTIADDSAFSLMVTIWGDRAQKDDSVFQGNPVVAMKGVLVKEWQGGRSGSLMEAGSMVLNPTDMPEAEKVLEWWKLGGNEQTITFISQTTGVPGGGRVAGKNADAMEMKKLSEQVLGEQEMYSVYCRLASVQLRKKDEVQPLCYIACLEPKEGNKLPCNRRVDENGFCATCQKAGKASAHFWVTTFHPAAEKVLSLTAQEVQQLEQESREVCESRLKEAYYGEVMQVHLRAKPDNYNGETRTNISCVAAQPVPVREHSRIMLKEIDELLAKSWA